MIQLLAMLLISAAGIYWLICLGWRLHMTTVANRAFRRDGLDAALIRIQSVKDRKPRWVL